MATFLSIILPPPFLFHFSTPPSIIITFSLSFFLLLLFFFSSTFCYSIFPNFNGFYFPCISLFSLSSLSFLDFPHFYFHFFSSFQITDDLPEIHPFALLMTNSTMTNCLFFFFLFLTSASESENQISQLIPNTNRLSTRSTHFDGRLRYCQQPLPPDTAPSGQPSCLFCLFLWHFQTNAARS